MHNNREPRRPGDSSEELTLTGIRPPTYVDLSGAWRDDSPTQVLNRPESQPPNRAASTSCPPILPNPDTGRDSTPSGSESGSQELSVIFRDAQSARPKSVPPAPSVRPLLPPPDDGAGPLTLGAPPRVSMRLLPPPLFAAPGSVQLTPVQLTPVQLTPVQLTPVQPTPVQPPPSVLTRSDSLGGLSGSDSMRPIAYDPPALPSKVGTRINPLHLAVAALLGSATLLGGFTWWQRQHGELMVDLADQQCGSMQNVRVFVDDELRCTMTPCALTVRTGGHLVRAEVEGRPETAAQAVFVSASLPALHKIQMGASDRTAIEVRGGPSNGELYINGRQEGRVPRRVTGLEAGEYIVEVRGDGGSVQHRVWLAEEQLVLLDLQSTVATTSAAPPRTSEGQPGTKAPSRASSAAPSDSPGAGAQVAEAANPASKATDAAESKAGAAKTAKVASAGKGTLRLTAEPSAMVLLNGRPLGHTPQQVSVEPGTHSLIFVHPTHGRTRTSAKVKAGQVRQLHARF